MTRNAIDYAWRELGRRAGVERDISDLGIAVHYCDPGKVDTDRPSIVVTPYSNEMLLEVLKGSKDSIRWIESKGVMPPGYRGTSEKTIPFIFLQDGAGVDKPSVEKRGAFQVVFNADILAATVFMLSRWEETAIPERDDHDRFPASASAAYRLGFLNRPVIDEYALILREWLKALCPRWTPKQEQFRIMLGHDIDLVYPFKHPKTFLRALAGHILKRKSFSLANQACIDFCRQIVSPKENSVVRGIYSLAQKSRENNLHSAFYFMTAKTSPEDSGYDLAQGWIRRIVMQLQEEGFEIGFHAGYYSFNNPERLQMEKKQFVNALGDGPYGCRLHYCRFKVPDTWRNLEHIGVSYDATMGYVDHEGFRCGTCHPFRPFDIGENRELDILEMPFVAMDGTFTTYNPVSPKEAEKRILNLAEKCKRVEGTFSLVWHNDMMTYEQKGWPDMYSSLVRSLAYMQKPN